MRSSHTPTNLSGSMLASLALFAFHDHYLAIPEWPSESFTVATDALWSRVEANHFYNASLWREEDLARRRNVPDSEIAKNKRAIDAFNQQRNDVIESIDGWILNRIAYQQPRTDARMSSETPGALIDRLSILSLKIWHMGAQIRRTNAGTDHVSGCRAKHAILCQQRTELGSCFDRLITEIATGDAYFRVYRQFKMYNDPGLNPHLYADASDELTRGVE